MTSCIHFIHTNDIHSHFSRVPRLIHRVKELRAEIEQRHEPVMVVDIGDHMDRASVETEGTDGRVNIALMRETGYDLVTIGNNEGLTFSKPKLEALYTKAPFKVLVTNFRDMLTGLPPAWADTSTICQLGDVKVGFLGATAAFQAFYELLEWDAITPLDILADEVELLKSRGAQLIVLLSHLGLHMDEMIAEERLGIDLILGAHTHHLLENGLIIGNTTIAHAGCFGQYVGHVEMKLNDRLSVDRIDCHVIPVADEPEDKAAMEIIKTSAAAAKKQLSEEVAYLHQPLAHDWFREEVLGNLLADALRNWSGSEISMVNAGQLLTGLHAGIVNKADLHRILPSPINPCRLVMTGEQIRRTLERSLDQDLQRRAIKGFGFRGSVLGMMNISGLQVQKKINPKNGQPELSIWVESRQAFLKDDDIYRVGSIDMFTFGHIYPAFREAKRVEFFLPEFLRDVLAAELQNKKRQRANDKRWLS